MPYRPLNRCSNCNYSWHPRGKNVSLRCPNCGGVDVASSGSGFATFFNSLSPRAFALLTVSLTGSCLAFACCGGVMQMLGITPKFKRAPGPPSTAGRRCGRTPARPGRAATRSPPRTPRRTRRRSARLRESPQRDPGGDAHAPQPGLAERGNHTGCDVRFWRAAAVRLPVCFNQPATLRLPLAHTKNEGAPNPARQPRCRSSRRKHDPMPPSAER